MTDDRGRSHPGSDAGRNGSREGHRRWLVFAPLLVFLAGAPFYLLRQGEKSFFLRWIDLCVGFFLALGACFLLKKLLLDADDDQPDDEPDQDGRP